jgi:hypothetical protein
VVVILSREEVIHIPRPKNSTVRPELLAVLVICVALLAAQSGVVEVGVLLAVIAVAATLAKKK